MVLYDTFHSICSLSSEGWSEAQIDYISQLQIKLPIRIIQIYIIADEKGQHAEKAPCLCSRLFDLFETELNWWFVSFVGLAWKYNIIVESEWNRWKQQKWEMRNKPTKKGIRQWGRHKVARIFKRLLLLSVHLVQNAKIGKSHQLSVTFLTNFESGKCNFYVILRACN